MRFLLPTAVLAGLLLLHTPLRAQRLLSVDPLTAKPGDTLSATGEGIGAETVDVLYLTDGANDIKLALVEQNGTTIKFKIPADCKAGKWSLMLHTTKDQLLEQPVKVTVE
jgi:hypothetical protein